MQSFGSKEAISFNRQIMELGTANLVKLHKKEIYDAISLGIRSLTLPKGWSVQFAETSITIASRNRTKVIKAMTDNRIFVDRVTNGDVKSEIIKCECAAETIKNIHEVFNSMTAKKCLQVEILNE